VLAAACVAGVWASVTVYRSDGKIVTALREVVPGGGDAATVAAMEDAKTFLNPDSLREANQAIVLARYGAAPRAEEIMLRVTEREPENQNAWIVLARVQATKGDRAAARRSYRRAVELNSQTPLIEPIPLRRGRQ
jgi:Flp pilus assembly protein TadD